MIINVKAKPSAGVDKVEKIDDENFVVSVKEPPVQGRANASIIKLLAGYFSVPSYNVSIVAGHMSRNKIVKVTP